MPFEPTTKGNPHKITKKQHFHAAQAIEKFYNGKDKNVEVKFIKTGLVDKLFSGHPTFYTKRTWDQRAESGYMASIETAFYKEIDNIKSYSDRNHHAISIYFLLWRLRYDAHLYPIDDFVAKGVTPYPATMEEQEFLESKSLSFIREENKIPSRVVCGMNIQMDLKVQFNGIKELKWGLMTACKGEFLVADSYQSLAFMPITPKSALVAGLEDAYISKQEVGYFNKQSVNQARVFYFARKISDCPIQNLWFI
jgi:hypothetical protein